jgi:hypothetical protein
MRKTGTKSTSGDAQTLTFERLTPYISASFLLLPK